LPDAADPLAPATRTGLPAEFRYLVEAFPRDRWTALPEVAAFWLQMHASFRGHQAHMDGLVGQWRSDGDLAALHRQLMPALQSFLQHLEGHHRVESGHYFPMMRTIEPRVGAGIDLLDHDHDIIHGTLDAMFRSGLAFHQAITADAADAADQANRLGDLIEAAGKPLLRHLEDEEDIVIPVIEKHGLA